MTAINSETLFAAVVGVVGVVVWLVRLEGKIQTQAELHRRLAEDVSYIRDRIDVALNGHR